MKRERSSFLLLAVLGCAEAVPGQTSPPAALNFPIGMALARGSKPENDRLLVANSNFDQRYASGSVQAFNVNALITAVAGAKLETPISADTLSPTSVRIPSFSGELLYVPSPTAGKGTIFVAARGDYVEIGSDGTQLPRQSSKDPPTGVTLIDYDEMTGMSCKGDGPTLPGIDCSEGHAVRTGAIDAYSLAFIPGPELGAQGSVAVGHLAPDVDHNADGTLLSHGDIALIDVAGFRKRIADESTAVKLVDDDPVTLIRTDLVPGITGLAYLPPTPNGRISKGLIAVSHDATSDASAFVQTYDVASGDLKPSLGQSMSGLTRATGMRSLALSASGTVAYATLRILQPGSGATTATPFAFNSGIAVMVLEREGFRLAGVVEVGNEVGKPALLERSQPGCGGGNTRTLYAPDQRDDRIWILDVTSDVPVVVGSIGGRLDRSESPTRLRTLNVPSEIQFICRMDTDGKVYGVVSNFSNGTLAVIDATDPDPRAHHLVATIESFPPQALNGHIREGEQ